MVDALALLQKGNLDYIAGRGVVAMHRDLDEPWFEHQPRFFIGPNAMARYAKEQRIKRLFWHSLVTDEDENGQPEKSTKSPIWQELWLTR